MSLVGLYARSSKVFLHLMDRADTGLWIGSAQVRTFSEPVKAKEIGAAILELLPLSRAVPHPASWKGLNPAKPLLDAAGVRSWSTFMKGSSSGSVCSEDGKLAVERSENSGSKGFTPLDSRTLDASVSPSELGHAALKALGLKEAEGIYR